MKLFDLSTLDVQPNQPEVLQSDAEGRSVAITLPAGDVLQEHETRERAWIVVASGRVAIEQQGRTDELGTGGVVVFDPHERREVRAVEDSRILLILAPWPAEPEASHRG